MKKREFRIVADDDGHSYVIPADEVSIFVKWVNFQEGHGRKPGNFEPVRVDNPSNVVFTEWREE